MGVEKLWVLLTFALIAAESLSLLQAVFGILHLLWVIQSGMYLTTLMHSTRKPGVALVSLVTQPQFSYVARC